MGQAGDRQAGLQAGGLPRPGLDDELLLTGAEHRRGGRRQRPGRLQAFHDLLYANQPEEGSAGLTDAQLLDYAVQAGAPRDAVAAAQASDRFGGWVTQRTDVFSQKYTSTPTILVDGTQLPAGIPTAQQMRDLVTKAAAAKGLPTPS